MAHTIVDSYINLLRQQPRLIPLHHPSRVILSFLSDIQDKSSFHKEVMLELISRFKKTERMTTAISELYELNFVRIKKEMDTNPLDYYEFPHDPFVKDLSICCLRAFPAGGARIVETYSGVGRRILFCGGLKGLIPATAFFLHARGFYPWYQLHIHKNIMSEFNEEGWYRCCLRIADMLRLNPEIKGMFGSSWYLDPAVEKISPRLKYLRNIPFSGGARFFHRGGDARLNIANATAKSQTRRKLYEAGKYKPTAYLMIWHRDDVLQWANRQLEPVR